MFSERLCSVQQSTPTYTAFFFLQRTCQRHLAHDQTWLCAAPLDSDSHSVTLVWELPFSESRGSATEIAQPNPSWYRRVPLVGESWSVTAHGLPLPAAASLPGGDPEPVPI